MLIGQANEDETVAAIKDVLFLFRDLAGWSGFAEGHATGTFAPWRFLNCRADGGWFTEDDVELLHRGAAVALLVELVDSWENSGGVFGPLRRTIQSGLDTGRFAHLPLAEEAVQAALVDEHRMHRCLARVHSDFVLGFFARLAGDQPTAA